MNTLPNGTEVSTEKTTYDYRARKLVVVISGGLDAVTALNVVGHLSITTGHRGDDLIGRPTIVDASGIPHFGIAKYSLVIKKANSNQLRRAIQLAREDAHVLLADYPREILTTGHDNELCQAIGNVKEDEIEYLGAMFYGPTANVDAITRKFSLWK